MRQVRRLGLVGAISAALVATACAGGSSSPSSSRSADGTPVQGGTASFAWAPGATPNYILPFNATQYSSVYNLYEFQQLMYRPLYLAGVNGTPEVDAAVSMAEPPVYSDGNQAVTVTLRNYKWSDGTPVTATDVAFFQNMAVAEKGIWAQYIVGAYPDNVTSMTIDSPTQVTFHLDKPYAPGWFSNNELPLITPMPAAWDKTSDSAAPGSGGCAKSVANCKAVYNYLSAKANDLSTYASDPLWKIVDGPFKLKSFNANGQITMAANKAYSGPVKPKLDAVNFIPFTSTTAEYNELLSGSTIDVGYVDTADVQPKGTPNPIRALSGKYTLDPWYWWGIDFVWPNYDNPSVGMIFKQLYFRQALERVVDQQAVIKGALKGYGYPTNGPVPIQPANPYASSLEKKGVYPFDVAAAKALLTAHGWKVTPGSAATCQRPGTAANQCGAGIPAGKKLQFNLEYADFGTTYDQSMNLFKSNASRAGIGINVRSVPFNTAISDATRCLPTDTKCTWQMVEFGGRTWQAYPTGEALFSAAGGGNRGGYVDTHANALIDAAQHSGSADAIQQYENYLAIQLPVLWQPMPTEQLTVINSKLRGVTPQNPLLGISPENWYFVK